MSCLLGFIVVFICGLVLGGYIMLNVESYWD